MFYKVNGRDVTGLLTEVPPNGKDINNEFLWMAVQAVLVLILMVHALVCRTIKPATLTCGADTSRAMFVSLLLTAFATSAHGR